MAQSSQLLRQLAVRDAQRYGVDPGVFLRQIQQESGFNPNARSSAGALGIAQFMPGTAAGYHINPLDPVQALDAAARYDASELKAFGGDYHKALAAYNAGAGNADKWNDPTFAGGQTYRYVRDILGGAENPTATGAGPRPSVATALAQHGPAVSAPQTDFAPLLAQALAQGGNDNYQRFYATLGQALQQRSRPAQPALQVVPLPAGRGETVPSQPLPDTGNLQLTAVPLTLSTRDGIQVDQRILPDVLKVAQQFGVKVNSGWRSAARNAAVGGAADSDHLRGDAVDFVGTPQQMQKLYQFAQGRFPYVEPWAQAGGNHVHISFLKGR